MSEGYLLCAFGKKLYFDLSLKIIKNIREFDTVREICILTDDKNYFENKKDNKTKLILFDYKNHLHQNVNSSNEWNKFGFIPKIYQHLYTPFDITLFFDVDMIFYKDFTFIFDLFKNQDLPILIGGHADENNKSPSNWHWNSINEVIRNCGYNCPGICSTLIIYNKNIINMMHTSGLLQSILDNLNNYKVKSLYANGYPDEIIYSLILGYLKIKPNKIITEWEHNHINLDSCNKNI